MNRAFSLLKLAFALIFSTLILSCGEEEAPEVTPSITIISPSVKDLLNKTIVIKAEVIQSGFSHAKIFLGSVLIGESEETKIEISYNTKQVSDGIHTLKIIATNNQGGAIEASIEIEIWNTLLTFSVPENFVSDGSSVWFFISDYNGTILGVRKGSNNQTVVFETPENYTKDQFFIFHQFDTYQNASNGISATIRSYTDIKPGDYWYKLPEPGSNIATGNYQLTITNVPVSYNMSHVRSENGSYSSSGSGNTHSFLVTVPIHNSNLFGFFTNNTDRNITPRYLFIEEISPGGSSVVDFQSFTEMSHIEYTFDSQMDQVTTTLSSTDSKFRRMIEAYSQTNVSNAKLYYPGSLFSEYFTSIHTRKGNRINYYNKYGSIPNSHKTLQANVTSMTFVDRNFTINSTGAFDFMRAQSSETWISANGKTISLNYWIYMNDEDKKEFKLVSLPAEILNENPEFSGVIINFKSVELVESDGYSSYQDFIRISLQAPEPFPYKYKESMISTITF